MARKIYFFFILLFIFTNCNKTVDYTPDTFADFERTKVLKGYAAKAFVDQMHFQAVAKDSNLVAFYQGVEERAIIYLTFYKDESGAQSDYQRMTQKISPENSVFVEGQHIHIAKKDVYRCFGMGQTHFVFWRQTILFWISLPTIGANDFLEAYLKYLNH